ncbi:NUDIX domain-containing protein [Nonomuraea jiangxiensis]|uniref:ADP-ribose pyrophosphatase YjhB, NUDIX family n=1 Tax=Nonomuraea jiangxiensis TaxID=633440 RepID=A0A1G9VI74_9ACTN|nr:NUDIX hydrolase [Nonomuraea jiangxiensis]SDM71884.1 ADP-ribose pyrophosphatase YjhB, NUDIX family [Nonomuraea jiangxiensis]
MPGRQHDPRLVVRDLVQAVVPYDERESADQQWVLDWIDAGHPLFRTAKPATPHRHLAVYAALLDEAARTLMLVDHAKAKAWLLPGGHVDPQENPQVTVVRELDEELKIAPPFHLRLGSAPFFLTVTETRPPHSHTDVTLWFVFSASQQQEIVPDLAEFSVCRWFALNDTAAWVGEFDPQMFRFMAKLTSALELAPVG